MIHHTSLAEKLEIPIVARERILIHPLFHFDESGRTILRAMVILILNSLHPPDHS